MMRSPSVLMMALYGAKYVHERDVRWLLDQVTTTDRNESRIAGLRAEIGYDEEPPEVTEQTAALLEKQAL